jgi:hypothetical protein
MVLYPFYDCVRGADEKIALGGTVHQQFNCASCGMKQTMPTPNAFHLRGSCEECGHITDIEKDGCNYMVMYTNTPHLLKEILK